MKKGKVNLSRLFLIISLVFGIIFIFIVPSFQSPDESAHYTKSYMISKGDFLPDKYSKKYGYCVPDAINIYAADKDSFISDLDRKYSYSDMYFDQLLPSEYEKCTYKEVASQNMTLFAHIVPATGILATNFVEVYPAGKDESTAVKLQFARFASLIVYSLICYFAIKRTPKFKKSMFMILLLPNSLLLRTMVSYDGLVMSVVALTLALMLELIYDEKSKFNKWYFMWFIFAGYLLLNIKVIYSIIFILMFAIPSERFGGKKEKIKKYIEMIALVLLFVIVGKFIHRGTDVVNPTIVGDQLKYIKGHLLKTFGILSTNIYDQFKIQMYWMFGTYGLLDTYMPQLFVFMLIVATIITIISDIFNEKEKMRVFYKIALFVLIVLSVYAMYGIMYLDWTPKVLGVVGGKEVTGIQGRYYLPLLLLIPIVFNNNLLDKIKNKKLKDFFKKLDTFLEENLYIFNCLALSLVVIFILLRFYI